MLSLLQVIESSDYRCMSLIYVAMRVGIMGIYFCSNRFRAHRFNNDPIFILNYVRVE